MGFDVALEASTVVSAAFQLGPVPVVIPQRFSCAAWSSPSLKMRKMGDGNKT